MRSSQTLQDQGYAAKLMDELLAKKPKKCRTRDKFGALPLHYAAKGEKFAAANVDALLKHFPAGESQSLSLLPLKCG